MNRKNKKLKGTVLFTVVSVMSILLIFLLSTLVLAASANKRSHKTYASTQTEYAARTAIESFFAAMESSKEIAESVENIGATPIYPTVNIDSQGFGNIFCYDDNTGDVLEDKIKVEKLDSQPHYLYNEESGKWETYAPIRISANAKLGKEENSMSAYIIKYLPGPVKPSKLIGFNSAGMSSFSVNGTFTGGATVGIMNKEPHNAVFSLTNESKFENDLTFINANFDVKTALDLIVSKPSTGTVVCGNLRTANNKLVTLKEYSVKSMNDVPYLYIEKTLDTSADKMEITADAGVTNNSPFNLICGDIYSTGKNDSTLECDIYLTNEAHEPIYSGGVMRNNERPTDITGNYKMYASAIGTQGANASKLKSWSKSVISQTDVTFTSKGGSIYSKGNLILYPIEIDGDVRVEQDLVAFPEGEGKNITINGDIVVGETFYFNDTFIKGNNGKIIYCKKYCKNNSADMKIINSSIENVDTDKKVEAKNENGDVLAEIIIRSIDEWKTDIYPASMELRAIRNRSDDSMIPTIDSIRNQLGLIEDAKKGIIPDPLIYKTEAPSDAYDKNYSISDTTLNVPDVIKESCVITGNTNSSRVLKISPGAKSIWVVLDNVSFGPTEITVDDYAGGTVNFLIKGTVYFQNVAMTSSNVGPDVEITKNTLIGVKWYGAEKSKLEIQNTFTLIGEANCPHTVLDVGTTGAYNIKYIYDNREVKFPDKAQWIGSAFFDNSAASSSKFSLAFVSGGTGDSGDIDTEIGKYSIMYFDH